MGKSKKKAAKRNSPIDQFEVIDNSQVEQFQSKCRFRKSCIQGDFDTARKMIEENPSIERIVDKSGWNGLHHAAAEGHFPIVELCIQSNFKINARTKEDETALLLASRNGHQQVVDYLIKENADVFAISKSGQNALSEAARKNRPLITSMLQDALQTPLASSTPREEKKKNSEDFSLVGTTNSDVDYIRKQLAEAKQKLTDKNNEVTTLKSEIIELHKELDLRTEQIEHMKGHFSREAAEKEIMITEIKSDIDLVSSDVERTNALLETETNFRYFLVENYHNEKSGNFVQAVVCYIFLHQHLLISGLERTKNARRSHAHSSPYFRESLEEENRKLMDILLRREETIKRLEVRARNALEISIRADDYIKSHSSRYEQLESSNKSLAAEKEELHKQVSDLLASKKNSYPELQKENKMLRDELTASQTRNQLLEDKAKEWKAKLLSDEPVKRAKIITPAASGDNEMVMAEKASRKMAQLKEENEFLKNTLTTATEKSKSLESELSKLKTESSLAQKSSESDLQRISSEFTMLEDQLQKLLTVKNGEEKHFSKNHLSESSFIESESEKVLALEEHVKLLDLENAFLARRINKLTSEKKPK